MTFSARVLRKSSRSQSTALAGRYSYRDLEIYDVEGEDAEKQNVVENGTTEGKDEDNENENLKVSQHDLKLLTTSKIVDAEEQDDAPLDDESAAQAGEAAAKELTEVKNIGVIEDIAPPEETLDHDAGLDRAEDQVCVAEGEEAAQERCKNDDPGKSNPAKDSSLHDEVLVEQEKKPEPVVSTSDAEKEKKLRPQPRLVELCNAGVPVEFCTLANGFGGAGASAEMEGRKSLVDAVTLPKETEGVDNSNTTPLRGRRPAVLRPLTQFEQVTQHLTMNVGSSTYDLDHDVVHYQFFERDRHDQFLPQAAGKQVMDPDAGHTDAPLTAIRVTRFADKSGFAIGILTQHGVFDGDSMVMFATDWARMHREMFSAPDVPSDVKQDVSTSHPSSGASAPITVDVDQHQQEDTAGGPPVIKTLPKKERLWPWLSRRTSTLSSSSEEERRDVGTGAMLTGDGAQSSATAGEEQQLGGGHRASSSSSQEVPTPDHYSTTGTARDPDAEQVDPKPLATTVVPPCSIPSAPLIFKNRLRAVPLGTPAIPEFLPVFPKINGTACCVVGFPKKLLAKMKQTVIAAGLEKDYEATSDYEATRTTNAACSTTTSITTDDILTAIVWRALVYARVKQLALDFTNNDVVTTVARACNFRGRRLQNAVPKDYCGNAVASVFTRLKVKELLLQNDREHEVGSIVPSTIIADIALRLRRDLQAQGQRDQVEALGQWLEERQAKHEKVVHVFDEHALTFIISSWNFEWEEAGFSTSGTSTEGREEGQMQLYNLVDKNKVSDVPRDNYVINYPKFYDHGALVPIVSVFTRRPDWQGGGLNVYATGTSEFVKTFAEYLDKVSKYCVFFS
ncbi:unnamed protein product, partial [Amoebophrya sp. A120]|eukprot:GSA120T00016099001.1